MAFFKDVNGREWTVKLDAPTIKEIRERLKIDPVDEGGKTFERIDRDPILLFETLYVVCRKQADQASISDLQFGEALGNGEVIEQATEALLNAILDFFPPKKRELLKAIREKNRRVEDLGLKMALAKIGDPELEAQAIAAMESKMDAEISDLLTRLNSVTSLPAGSG